MPTDVLSSVPVPFDLTFLTVHSKMYLKSNGYEVKSPLIEALQIHAPSITIMMEHCQLVKQTIISSLENY
jgi:hypothetical protein